MSFKAAEKLETQIKNNPGKVLALGAQISGASASGIPKLAIEGFLEVKKVYDTFEGLYLRKKYNYKIYNS